LTFNDLSSPLSLVETRRSAKPRDLVAPGPSPAQIDRILKAAIRVPDHGKLAPWRVVVIEQEQSAAFAKLLEDAYRADKPDAGRLEIEAMHQFAGQGETIIIVISQPVEESKIPLWEQELSAGALCMNILSATHATGFAAGWLTGAAAYLPAVLEGLGAGPNGRIAGFIFVGSPGRPLEERPRPDFTSVVRRWDANVAAPG
jgi:nitroreductase